MEQTFSTHWKSSTQPRKQRKYRHNAPLHVRGTFLHAHLTKDLRVRHGTRSLRLRKGDEIKVLRGQFSGKTGKVERIDLVHTRVYVTGIDQAKRDGTKRLYPLQPSNLLLTKLTDDKRRLPQEAKAKAPKAARPAAPAAKPAQAKKPLAKPAAGKQQKVTA